MALVGVEVAVVQLVANGAALEGCKQAYMGHMVLS